MAVDGHSPRAGRKFASAHDGTHLKTAVGERRKTELRLAGDPPFQRNAETLFYRSIRFPDRAEQQIEFRIPVRRIGDRPQFSGERRGIRHDLREKNGGFRIGSRRPGRDRSSFRQLEVVHENRSRPLHGEIEIVIPVRRRRSCDRTGILLPFPARRECAGEIFPDQFLLFLLTRGKFPDQLQIRIALCPEGEGITRRRLEFDFRGTERKTLVGKRHQTERALSGFDLLPFRESAARRIKPSAEILQRTTPQNGESGTSEFKSGVENQILRRRSN